MNQEYMVASSNDTKITNFVHHSGTERIPNDEQVFSNDHLFCWKYLWSITERPSVKRVKIFLPAVQFDVQRKSLVTAQ